MFFNGRAGFGNAFAQENPWARRIGFEKRLEEKFGLTEKEKLQIEETEELEKFCRKEKRSRERIKFILQQIKRRGNANVNANDTGRDNRIPAAVPPDTLRAQRRGNCGLYKMSDRPSSGRRV